MYNRKPNIIRPEFLLAIAALGISLLTACSPGTPAQGVMLVDDQPAQNIIYVTATSIPLTFTPIPTLAAVAPTTVSTPLPTVTPLPVQPDPEAEFDPADCGAMLLALWTAAGDVCLDKPAGYVCNGGIAPRIEPAGPVSNALAVYGALVEAQAVDLLHTAPIMTAGNTAGTAWLRLDGNVKISGLLVGDVALRDVTESHLPAWQSFTVETNLGTTESLCDFAPKSSFIVQSPLGQSTSLVVNGASIDLDGTLALQTTAVDTILYTRFIALSGRVRVIARGEPQVFWAGQQVIVPYVPGDLQTPTGFPTVPEPLERDAIHNLPIFLIDRPVLLPQPGTVATEGNVNLRDEPSTQTGEVLQQIPAGEIMSVLGRSRDGEWLHVQLDTVETGWMFAELLRQSIGTIDTVYNETPVPPMRYGELGVTARVNAPTGVNLRDAPHEAHDILATLPYGTEMNLLGRSPYSPFVKVHVGGMVGWVALIALETTTRIEALPVDYEAPPPPPPTPIPVYGDNAFPDPSGG